VKAKEKPVKIRAGGIILKSLRQYLSNVPGMRKIKQLSKKKSDVGHCTHTAETGPTNVKVQNMFRGQNNATCNTNCKYRTAATLYILETWFLSGI
jgi:hypothetical protein